MQPCSYFSTTKAAARKGKTQRRKHHWSGVISAASNTKHRDRAPRHDSRTWPAPLGRCPPPSTAVSCCQHNTTAAAQHSRQIRHSVKTFQPYSAVRFDPLFQLLQAFTSNPRKKLDFRIHARWNVTDSYSCWKSFLHISRNFQAQQSDNAVDQLNAKARTKMEFIEIIRVLTMNGKLHRALLSTAHKFEARRSCRPPVTVAVCFQSNL